MRLEASVGRPLIHVACGVLTRPSGEVLLAQRPGGKIAAGFWEFPGGKIEAGEPGSIALARELDEELGVQVRAARPLIRFRHDYSNRSVLLDTWLVTRFDGTPQSREAQDFRWVRPGELRSWPQALPTVAPIARALALPSQYVFTAPAADPRRLLEGLPKLPTGALLRLRLPSLDGEAYRTLAEQMLPMIRTLQLRLVLDRAPEMAAALGADGWHADAARLQALSALPARAPTLCLASCHCAADVQRAASLGFDAAVLGSVLQTPSHPGSRPLGWHGFGQRAAYAGLPVYAIGGVGPGDLDRAHAVWGQGIAGISAYWPD